MQLILDLLKMLMPSIVDNYQQISAMGSLIRAQLALKSLKTLAKTVEPTEQLMVRSQGQKYRDDSSLTGDSF
jgi:hypothetical protein